MRESVTLSRLESVALIRSPRRELPKRKPQAQWGGAVLHMYHCQTGDNRGEMRRACVDIGQGPWSGKRFQARFTQNREAGGHW